MSDISDKVFGIYNQLSENEKQPIDEKVVEEAMGVINHLSVNSTNSLFLFLSATNLLNSAIKTANYKTQLSYGLIKGKVSQVAEIVLKDISSFDGTSVYYSKSEKCVYFSVLDVIFSFHQIQETNIIMSKGTLMEPISWSGIRLQRIAQKLYFLAKDICDLRSQDMIRTATGKTIASSDNKPKHPLFHCPDCDHQVSSSALFCPNCGCPLDYNNTLLDGFETGNIVKISYNGILSEGKIEVLSNRFLEISLGGGKKTRVRTNAIDSIELVSTNEMSIELFAKLAEDFFSHLLDITKIDTKALISTNSTITNTGKAGLFVITDSGETVECFKHGIVGFKKKDWSIGKRVYCGNIGNNNRCYNSILEVSYDRLINFFKLSFLHKNSIQNITQTRRSQLLFILTFFMKEITNNPEAYLEIKNFRKKAKVFFEQSDENNNNESANYNTTISTEGIDSAISEHHDAKIDCEGSSREIFKTDTEKQPLSSGTPQLNFIEKIDIYSKSHDKKDSYETIEIEEKTIVKPSIITSKEVLTFLNKKLTNLPEPRCKAVEKELDTLIRNGKKEECLTRSYQIITTSRPTPKYLRSYLDRIVNTEIALDHTEQALKALAYLIAFSEKQEDTNSNTLGHLYITMARLYIKLGDKGEAQKAILYAEGLKPNNSLISKLKSSVDAMQNNEVTESYKVIHSMSEMLLQDVEQEAHRLELLPTDEVVLPEQLFGKAQNNRNNPSETFENKASLFLEAAAAYYNNKQTDTIMFKISIANFARLKGHGMFTRFSNLLDSNSWELSTLQALRDSACSYYIEALGVFNALGEKNYLQELFLKYLQLTIVISNIEGGKTPADDWEDWTLKQLQLDCLKADSLEEKKVLFSACISVGTAAEGAWNTLYSDEDGLNPFISRFRSQKFRDESYGLFNELAGASVSSNYQPGAFMHKIFEHRQVSINELNNYIKDCISWPFSTYAISTFEPMWNKVVVFKDLLTETDKKVMSSINEVIEILKPYASRVKGDERTSSLANSLQLLYGAQKIVSDTTTFYGKTFFSHLINNWLRDISRQLDERNISSYPKLDISPEPCYIKTDDDGLGYISFVVSNTGDSTAQSYIVEVNVEGKLFSVSHDSELTSGDCSAELVKTDLLSNIEHTYVQFKIIAKYRGKDIPPVFSEATYEKEPSSPLTDETQIPWHISNTPEENVFKGREEKLATLVSHYLSKDRSTTYILYGLTRTGKSSILDYLCERINEKKVKENTCKKILTFKWDLSKIPYKNSKPSILWTNLLETRIYECLPEDLAHEFVNSCPNKELPSPDNYNQMYLRIIIDTLNNNNYIPLITIDEFSYIRKMLEEGLVDATFIKNLRDLALEGKACFVYAGTYDIKDLPKEKDFGLAGVMNNTTPMHINEIEAQYANELIDACPYIIFDKRAKDYIRALSGCVPWWIQWICLGCGKYALAKGQCHLGFKEVNDVVKVLTEEVEPAKNDTWADLKIAEENFDGNQIDINNIAEQKLITCISYLIRESTQIERGVSMDELKRLWDQYNVNEDTKNAMVMALSGLEKRKIIRQFRDEEREVYRLNVDLFRRWWYAHHRDLNKELLMN